MKPSALRYLLAYTADLSAGIGVLAALGLMLGLFHSEETLVPERGVVVWIVLAAVPVAAIGWITGTVVLWGMILGRFAARLQGWPFAVGERLWLLSGKHKNRIATVYEVWPERGQVRVDLGSEAKEKFEDVFFAVAVCRTRDTD